MPNLCLLYLSNHACNFHHLNEDSTSEGIGSTSVAYLLPTVGLRPTVGFLLVLVVIGKVTSASERRQFFAAETLLF